MIFDKVLLNEENVYNVIFGIFIVLVDGIYFFFLMILIKGGKYFIIDIMFNCWLIIFNYIDGRGWVGYFMLFLYFNI